MHRESNKLSALKVLSLRLRGMKGELEELGEETDENVESISKMQTQVLNLTKGKVNIFNDDGSFKSTYEIMDGIADIYDELLKADPTAAADLLETIAGKNRANDVAALLSNWEQVEAAMKSAMGAEGSATEENKKYVESVQGHLNELRTSWQALSNTFIKTDVLKGLIDGLTIIVELLDKALDIFGSFGTISLGFSVFKIFGSFSSNFSKNLSEIQEGIKDGVLAFSDYKKAAKGALKGFMSTPAGIAAGIGLITTAVSTAIQAYKNWRAEQERQRQQTIDNNNEIIDANNKIFDTVDEIELLYSKYANNTSLTAEQENELKTAIDNTATAFGNKSGAMQQAIEDNNNYAQSIHNVVQAQLVAAKERAFESVAKTKENLLLADNVTVGLGSETSSDELTEIIRDIASKEMPDFYNEYQITVGKNRNKKTRDAYKISPDYENADDIVQYYLELKQLESTLRTIATNENNDSYITSDIYKDIENAIISLSPIADEYLTQQYNLAKYDYEIQNGIPKTVEEYYKMRDAMLSNIDASQDYKDAIGDIADAEWDDVFDLKSYNETLNKAKTIKQKFADTNPFDGDAKEKAEKEFGEWIDSLPDERLDIVYDIALNTDTTDFELIDWVDAFENYKIPEEAKISFSDLIVDDDFTSEVDKYIENVQRLQNALESIRDGTFTNKDFIDLAKEFPDLAHGADNLEDAIVDLLDTMDEDIEFYFDEQSSNLEEDDVELLQNFKDAVLELGKVVGNTDISIDISAESEGMENLFSAMKESVSSTGLTAESIKNLKTRYQELENYDVARLFERTSNGIHLNTKALRELESSYEKQKKQKIDDDLQSLIDKYNDLTVEIDNTSDHFKRSELYAQRSEIQDQINDVADLAAQYAGLTSAFYKWEQAQSIGEEGDMYDSLSGGLENIKQLYEDGLIGTNKFRAAVQLMTNEDLSTASIDELIAAYESGYPKMTRYFTDSADGCLNFLNDVQNLNSEWVKMNDDGSWDINFGVGDDQEIADALGINVESVQSVLRKLSDYGFDINLDSIYTSLEFLEISAEKANDKLIELGKTDIKFNFDTDDIDTINTQITDAQTLLNTFKNSDGTVNLSMEGAEEAQEILVTLITKKQLLNAPSVMSVNTSSADSNITKTIGLLKDFQTNYNNIEIEASVGIDTTTAQTNIQGILGKLDGIPDDIKAKLGLDSAEFTAAVETLKATEVDVKAGVNLDSTALDTITSTIKAITPEMMVTAGLDSSLIDGYNPDNKEAKVNYGVDDSKVKSYRPPNKTAQVIYRAKMNHWTAPTKYGTVIYNAKFNGGAKARGTAYAKGTFGKAYKRGDWGTKDSGVAIGGELGQELIVRDGRFFTIGDKSAEFFTYKKGDIIFNAEQTKQIFEKGKISNGAKRGVALADGTAKSGKAFSSGTGKIVINGSVVTSASDAKEQGNDSSKNKTDDFKETFDWIEVAIDRVERAISNLDLKANSVYKSWSKRNNSLKKEISEIRKEIEIQQAGYDRYIQEANSVGLSDYWVTMVQNGEIDIDKITNEELAEKIKEYQEWYL